MKDERRARMALMCVSEPGSPSMSALVGEHGPVGAWAKVCEQTESTWSRRAALVDVDEVVNRTRELGLEFVIPGDPHWPTQLETLDAVEVSGMGGAPLGLWIRGKQHDLNALAERAVSVVGSRASSSYGEMMACDIAAEISDRAWTVISGGAYGIDAAAHRGAMAGEGGTVCVLACGLDQDYPRQHHHLLATIAEQGAVVGELPPGARPMRSRFLGRNRIIAGLSAGTVLIEAAHRSGAKNTVSWAESMGKPVFALPGPVSSSTSATPHELIRSRSAELITSGRDVLEFLAPYGQELLPLPEAETRPVDELSRRQRSVFEHVPGSGPGETAQQIAAASGLPPGMVFAMLGELLVKGFVVSSGNRWVMASGAVG